VRVGRFYWAYDGALDPSEQRQVDALLRWVRRRSMPLPSDRRFRVFEHAARNGRILDFGLNIREPSPPWPG
jgi:hypothetical protein